MAMKRSTIEVGGKSIEIHQDGSGPPLLYIHGIWDIHTLQADPFPFHEQLAEKYTVTMPVHPGCGESTGMSDITEIEDLAFHYLDLLDALEIKQATVVGFSLGGWIATEMAVRNPERIGQLVLIDSAGLQVPGTLVGDLFMYVLHRDGGVMQELRELLFKDPDSTIAHEIIPDGRVNIPDEVLRYKSVTLAARVGWEPPYLFDKKLLGRLHRITSPTLVLWGEQDRLIPMANGQAYVDNIPQASLQIVKDAGHSTIIEQPEACVERIAAFLDSGKLPASDTPALAPAE
jgi:pimeloyl-ACP methyl ester carboxylesterase